MKRIILTTSLFFCLAITTVFAQVTPVNTTKTSTSTVGGVTVIGIATPVNGLSNNTYSDFNISNSGIILNNSGSDSSSQLTSGIVSGNSNITGSPASLILNQVTSTSTNVSSLSGTAEVVGNKAGIIIANPNGITCAGCGFINADRVDLVTGTYNIATGTYSISDNDFTVNTGGLLANTVGVLNIQTNNFTNNDDSPGVSADTFNLSVAGDFNNAGIDVNTFNLSLAGDFNQRQYLEIHANTFNLSVAGDFDHIAYYSVVDNGFITNSEGRLYVDALNLNVGGDFSFSESANDFIWRENDILTVSGSANIIAASFNNSGNIYVDNSFNATVNSFINQAGATITTFGECNIVATSSTDNGTITCLNSVGETTILDIARPDNGLSNNSYEPFHISINGVVFNNSDSTTTSQLLGDDISKNPNYDVGDAASIILAQVSGPNSFLFGALEVVGDEAAVIIANPNGITCNGCGFINASRVDLVTGSNYNFNTDNFNSIANTNIAIIGNGLDAASVDILNIHAGGFTNTGGLKANTFNLNVAGNFSNSGSITTDSLNITAGYTAINQGSIVSNSLNITAHDFFRNLTGGDISTDTLNIIAGGKVTNTANITVGTLNIIANDDSSRTNDTTGFYVSNRGNITADNFVITAVDNFYNRGNITTTSGFNTGARNIFFFNEEIDSFTGTYDGGTITLGGDSSFIAGGAIENYGNIDLNSNNLTIVAGSFINHVGATIDAATLNLDVSSFINDGTIDAIINQ